MQIMKSQIKTVAGEIAFTKGMREVAGRDRREAAALRDEICQVLDIGRSQFYNRQRGTTPPTPAERDVISRIFRRYKVAEPWGE